MDPAFIKTSGEFVIFSFYYSAVIINGDSERTFQNNTNNCTGAKFLPQNMFIGCQGMKKLYWGGIPPWCRRRPAAVSADLHTGITGVNALSLVIMKNNNTTSREWPVVFMIYK